MHAQVHIKLHTSHNGRLGSSEVTAHSQGGRFFLVQVLFGNEVECEALRLLVPSRLHAKLRCHNATTP